MLVDARKYRIVDFGCVIPGNVYKKKVKINSHYKLNILCPIETHPLEEAFTVEKPENKDNKIDNKFIVHFNPTAQWHKSASYQIIKAVEEGVSEAFALLGNTIGPVLSLNLQKLSLRCNYKTPVRKVSLQLKNTTQCPDRFMWDFDSNQSELIFSPRTGKINGNETVIINVKFIPKRKGLYFRQIFCLFTMHEPIMVELRALHTKEESCIDLKTFITSTQPLPTYPSMYCRYINDVAKKMYPESKPLLKLNYRYFNFGSAWVEDGEFLCQENLLLTSYFFTDIEIIWEEDQSGIFSISPRKAFVKRGSQLVFKALFHPKHSEMIYSTELSASIFWGTSQQFMTPVPVTLMLIGNTFPPSSCGWDPFAEVSRKRIILPATIPLVPSYTTFLIHRTSDLPIQFTLYPKDKKDVSHFLVKPSQGLIVEDFQIVVVQLFPGEKADEAYNEKWILMLNLAQKIELEFCGTIEKPFLKVGQNKDIIFPITNIFSACCRVIAIKNPTRLHLKYRCKDNGNPLFQYDTEQHEIGPNEEHQVKFSFLPKSIGEFRVVVGIDIEWWDRLSKAESIQDPRRNGRTETVVYLKGTSEKIEISCHPDYLLIDDVLKNTWGEGRFILINNGKSVACISLECESRMIASYVGPYEFIPNQICIPPNKDLVVKIRCKGLHVGLQTLRIVYTVYTSSDFKTTMAEDKTFLLLLDFACIYPIIQIIDIRYRTFCKNLHKVAVWNMLMIDQINKHLEKTYLKAEQKCYMKFPEDIDECPFFLVQLLVRNISCVPVKLEITYIKSCQCYLDNRSSSRKSSLKRDSISSRTYCEHHQEFSSAILCHLIKPCSNTIIEMDSSYNYQLARYFKAHWRITAVDEEAKIENFLSLFVERQLILPDKGSIDIFFPGPNKEFDVDLIPQYIGDGNNYLQIISIYNNSQFDVEYAARFLENEDNAFKLLNPIATIAGVAQHPLLIKFNPNKIKEYKANIFMSCSHSTAQILIHLKSKGIITRNEWTYTMPGYVPLTSLFPENLPLLDADLSVAHICIRPMSTHSYEKKAFFLKNNTEDELEYDWRTFIIWGVIEISVSPQSGVLAPGQIIACHLYVKSMKFPAKFNCSINCVIDNLTKQKKYQKKTKCFSKVAKLFDSCFSYEDGETKNPTVGMKVGPAPLNTFLTLGLSILIYDGTLENLMYPTLAEQIKNPPGRQIDLFQPIFDFNLTTTEADSFMKILIGIIGDIMRDPKFLSSLEQSPNTVRYVELDENSKESKKPKLQSAHMSSMITNILYNNFMNLFDVDNVPGCQYSMLKHSKYKRLKINNLYYSEMMAAEANQVLQDIGPLKQIASECVSIGGIREQSGTKWKQLL